MTVIFSKRCELGLQAVLYLSTLEANDFVNAKQIAGKLQIPKEFVAKVLQFLTESGIVGSKKGKYGGFYLAKNPKKVRLIDIVEAIDGLETFDSCVLGFRECSPDSPCPVHEKWGKLREEALHMLTNETLDQLKDQTLEKIKTLKTTND